MGKKIEIGIVDGPMNKITNRSINVHEGFVTISNPQDRVWLIEFFVKSPLFLTHQIKLLDRPDGEGITEQNWAVELANAIRYNGIDDNNPKSMLIGDTAPYEVITSLGMIDFKITIDDKVTFITTQERTEEITNPIVPQRVVLFKNIVSGNSKPVEFLFTADGIQVRRKNYDGTMDIYRGNFTHTVSGRSRMLEYLGVGDLQNWDFHLNWQDSNNSFRLQARASGEFSWIESLDGKIAFTRCRNPIEVLLQETKNVISRSGAPTHLKDMMETSLNNLVIRHTVRMLRDDNKGEDLTYTAIGAFLAFQSAIEELRQVMLKFSMLGTDSYASNQTRY